MLTRLKNWTATLAGGRITITHRAGSVPHKVPDIVRIEATDDGIIATHKDGTRYLLGNPA